MSLSELHRAPERHSHDTGVSFDACGPSCTYKALYKGTLQTNAEMSKTIASITERVDHIRAGVVSMLKRLYPRSVRDAENAGGVRLGEVSDEVLLAYLESFHLQGGVDAFAKELELAFAEEGYDISGTEKSAAAIVKRIVDLVGPGNGGGEKEGLLGSSTQRNPFGGPLTPPHRTEPGETLTDTETTTDTSLLSELSLPPTSASVPPAEPVRSDLGSALTGFTDDVAENRGGPSSLGDLLSGPDASQGTPDTGLTLDALLNASAQGTPATLEDLLVAPTDAPGSLADALHTPDTGGAATEVDVEAEESSDGLLRIDEIDVEFEPTDDSYGDDGYEVVDSLDFDDSFDPVDIDVPDLEEDDEIAGLVLNEETEEPEDTPRAPSLRDGWVATSSPAAAKALKAKQPAAQQPQNTHRPTAGKAPREKAEPSVIKPGVPGGPSEFVENSHGPVFEVDLVDQYGATAEDWLRQVRGGAVDGVHLVAGQHTTTKYGDLVVSRSATGEWGRVANLLTGRDLYSAALLLRWKGHQVREMLDRGGVPTFILHARNGSVGVIVATDSPDVVELRNIIEELALRPLTEVWVLSETPSGVAALVDELKGADRPFPLLGETVRRYAEDKANTPTIY